MYYNIAYGRADAAPSEIENAARLARIHHFIESLPDGYDAMVGERGLKLSGGEKQRLALARALIIKPAILFLDEPTSNLDPTSVETIEQNLQLVSQQGTKIILVTHDLGQAKRLAGDVLFLHHGKLSEHSPATSFFKNPESEAANDYLAGKLVL